MTVVAKNLLQAKAAENAQTTQFTSASVGYTILDKMTATNTTAGAVTLSVNLVPSGSAAAASNLIESAVSIAAGTTYLCPGISGHILNAGDFVSTLAGAAASITIRISGRVVS